MWISVRGEHNIAIKCKDNKLVILFPNIVTFQDFFPRIKPHELRKTKS